MNPSSMQRITWTVAIAAGIVVLAAVALPFLASTRLAGDRIAEELGEWSGLEVTIGGSTEIDFWPDLQANLADVTLSAPGGAAVITAERVEIEISPLGTLGGALDFSLARFVRPTLRLREDDALPAFPSNGTIARSIEIAKQIVAEDRSDPDVGRLPDDDFGVVEFADGRIVREIGGSDDEIANGLSGRIGWETLDGSISASVQGTARREQFALQITADRPLLLLGGGASQVAFVVKSVPVSASFDGTASLGENPYADGRVALSAPALPRPLRSLENAIPRDPGPIAIEGRIIGDSSRVRLEEAVLTLNGTPARGALDLMLNGRLPMLSGTLAFDDLDLSAFLSAFTPFDAAAASDRLDVDFASRLDLDLRLSAKRASAGTIALTDVAATTRLDRGFAAFDISDASAFGGSIQAGVRFDRRDDSLHAEVRLLASDIDGGALGAATGWSPVMPQANGTLSVILKSDGDSWSGLLAEADGSLAASFGQGVLPAIAVADLVARSGSGTPFPLSDLSGGAMTMEGMDFKSAVSDGIATIEKAEIRSPPYRLVLDGAADLASRSLDITGIAQAQMAGQPAEPPAATDFRITGPWSAAIVTPGPAGPGE
jgi:AsmA protein